MEEQKDIQPEQEIEETDQTEKAQVQPTVEELQKQVEEANKEIERKEGVLQQTKRELKEAQKRGGSKAEIEALGKKIESQEEWIANALDDIVNRVAGEYEESKPSRKSYSQQLEERRAKSKPEPTKPDPEAQKFLAYCDAMDLHLDYEDLDGCDPLVKEALGEGRNFREGLKYLKDKMKNKDTVDIDKLVNEKLQTALEQKLKEMGLTTSGAGSPSAPASSFEKTEQDYADGKISTEEYRKARKDQGILS
jgi:hypothetical protein